MNIGSDVAIPIQAIKPTGEDLSDNINLQTLDFAGRTVASYLWVNWAGEGGDQEAWIDADTFDIVSDVTFTPGDGLWVTGSSTDQGIQTAGQVGTSDVVVALREGGTVTGNPFPVSLNLQEIVPEGADTSDNVNLQTLDFAGRTVASYLWVNWAGEDGDQEAWIDADTFDIVTDVTFAPGEGLWVTGSSNSQSIRFPAPEL